MHINLPLICSDSYCYNVAIKILNNFPAGRKVYVELADEPWNWGSPIFYQVAWFNQFLGYTDQNAWYVDSHRPDQKHLPYSVRKRHQWS